MIGNLTGFWICLHIMLFLSICWCCRCQILDLYKLWVAVLWPGFFLLLPFLLFFFCVDSGMGVSVRTLWWLLVASQGSADGVFRLNLSICLLLVGLLATSNQFTLFLSHIVTGELKSVPDFLCFLSELV